MVDDDGAFSLKCGYFSRCGTGWLLCVTVMYATAKGTPTREIAASVSFHLLMSSLCIMTTMGFLSLLARCLIDDIWPDSVARRLATEGVDPAVHFCGHKNVLGCTSLCNMWTVHAVFYGMSTLL